MQIGADLEGVKWLSNGYELKLKRWSQDSVAKYSRSKMEDPHGVSLPKKVRLSRYLETGTW